MSKVLIGCMFIHPVLLKRFAAMFMCLDIKVLSLVYFLSVLEETLLLFFTPFYCSVLK